MEKSLITLKIGGRVTEQEELVLALGSELKALHGVYHLLLVHGGGEAVSHLSRRLGLEPVFKEGIRLTTPAEMNIVEMVLAGRVNKRLVRILRRQGLAAVGLSGSDGGIFTGCSIGGPAGEIRTGTVTQVNPDLTRLLMRNHYLPVISSATMDEAGLGLNINADSVALALAQKLGAHSLVFLSDIPGVLRQGEVLRTLCGSQARRELENGTIAGGMIPKVRAALEALERGVGQIVIGQYLAAGSLERLLVGDQGTRITLREE